jgi:hypothetical protein
MPRAEKGMQAAVTDVDKPKERVRSTTTKVASVETLVGAHPDALRDIYASGTPADPTALGSPRGRLCSLEPLAAAYALTRPVVVALSRIAPWQGKLFESGGTSGRNLLLGRPVLRFSCEAAESELDGRPTLAMRYDGLGNPAPFRRVVDELRVVGEGVALGVTLLATRRGWRPIWWWALETR